MRIGFIGTGSMGSMLIRAFLASGDQSTEIVACNRTSEKMDRLITDYPLLQKLSTPSEVALKSDVLFLCVKPKDAWPVIKDMIPSLRKEQFFVSINSAIMMEEMEAALPCKVVKLMPSITQEAIAGVLLVMYGQRMEQAERSIFERFINRIGQSVEIREQDLRVCSDLTSCGPAFLAFMLQALAQAASRQGNISIELAETLVREMAIGTGKLFGEKGFLLEEVITRVSVPGGITAAGLKAMDPAIHELFDHLLITTHQMQSHHLTSRDS